MSDKGCLFSLSFAGRLVVRDAQPCKRHLAVKKDDISSTFHGPKKSQCQSCQFCNSCSLRVKQKFAKTVSDWGTERERYGASDNYPMALAEVGKKCSHSIQLILDVLHHLLLNDVQHDDTFPTVLGFAALQYLWSQKQQILLLRRHLPTDDYKLAVYIASVA
ncbi:hypothetical protein IW261DRAFT_983213 [Armillaria novae-zelandiae]|uniref:Uncharacterized protein n=1 Tax=Armillaria novae-zelandiae TaxID=153914 RepID=A0AA39PIE6_9AGAR|nr:hypothetical protein IW261DRAFT_983213 [Armillaria novae-zelandiae]